jgi:starch-binding outer membrane protein, SusD/RagB family
MYNRIYYQISLANEYIRQTTDERLNDRGESEEVRTKVRTYRAEARFLRALSYFHAMDMFGNVPFVTELDQVGVFLPEQIMRADLFDYIETELLQIKDQMVAPRANEYGRADQGAAWSLLARMYLNAEVYTDLVRWEDALTYSKLVIDAGYELQPVYAHLFNADNNPLANPDSREIIFAVRYDGVHTIGFGGTTFLIKSSLGGDMNSVDYGVNDKWGGHRTTVNVVNRFNYANETIGSYDQNDSRAMFYTLDHEVEIQDRTVFSEGYAVEKFTNLKRDGQPGSSLQYADTDFPLFRLAEMYLIYAEAHIRGGGGSLDLAVGYINALRNRAFTANPRLITNADLTPNFILDERGRELYWEGHRRTDLIRFNSFAGGSYLWPFKANVVNGGSTNVRNNLFPLPFTDTSANPNLTQNPGY